MDGKEFLIGSGTGIHKQHAGPETGAPMAAPGIAPSVERTSFYLPRGGLNWLRCVWWYSIPHYAVYNYSKTEQRPALVSDPKGEAVKSRRAIPPHGTQSP